ncbi:MAG: endo-1,4-beta-xylanase [Oscillospiraceae bacterium]|nr:endo-1,4-beta-xylanase [Oscillospiraceae bacterium]
MDEKLKLILDVFRKTKAQTDARTARDIEENRKGDLTVAVTDGGRPVERAHIALRQRTHDFRFGCNLFMLDELETAEKNERYKQLFADTFNLATLPFYWCDLEPERGKPRFTKDSPRVYRRPTPDLCVEYCKAHGIEPKLHCLNYDRWSPRWLPQDVGEIKRLLERRIREIAARYADDIPGMGVTNELLSTETHDPMRPGESTVFYREPDIVEWSFAVARKYLPHNRLIINETNNVWRGFRYDRSQYYMQIERALSRGAEIDEIGLQYHLFYLTEENVRRTYKEMCSAQNILNVLDQLAKLGRPLQITEITIPAYSGTDEDEQAQAELLTALYTLWFSHPAMEAIIYWNLVDGYAAWAKQGDMTQGENRYYGGLLRFDFSEKPAYRALKKLTDETWRTKLDADFSGTLQTRGFYGEYDAEITANGKTVTKRLHLQKGAENRVEIAL